MYNIRYEKKINYYNKKDFMYTDVIEKKTFKVLEEAIKQLKSCNLNYIENKKGISAYEEATLFYKVSPTQSHQSYKIIDMNSKKVITRI